MTELTNSNTELLYLKETCISVCDTSQALWLDVSQTDNWLCWLLCNISISNLSSFVIKIPQTTWVSAVVPAMFCRRGFSLPWLNSMYTVLGERVENSLLKHTLYTPLMVVLWEKLSYCFFISLYKTLFRGSVTKQSTS